MRTSASATPTPGLGSAAPGPVEARLNGVARGLTSRLLVGSGWTVAAMTRPGGLGAFIAGSAAEFTDRVVPLGSAIGVAEAALVARITAEPDEAARVGLLAAALEQAVDPERAGPARQVADAARLAEDQPGGAAAGRPERRWRASARGRCSGCSCATRGCPRCG